MKKIFLILFLLYTCVSAQQGNSGIELPEFVITGVERVSLPMAAKPKAEFFSIVSEDFLLPVYSPEELKIADLSNPVKPDVNLFDKGNLSNGRISAGLGFWIAPAAEFYYGNKSEYVLYSARLFGINERAYVTNAGVNSLGAELNTSFFIDHNSPFLPGSEIRLGGRYLRDGYKYYASETPGLKRDFHDGSLWFGLTNLKEKIIKYDFNINNNIAKLSEIDLNENLFSASGYMEFQVKDFAIGGNAVYKNQKLENNRGPKSGYGFYGLYPFIALKTGNAINLNLGFKYAHQDTNNFFSPFAIASMKINKYFSLLGEYNPSADMLGVKDLAGTNRYVSFINRDNFFLRENMDLKFAIRYEYETYFEVDAGVNFVDYKYYPYFSDTNVRGKFEVNSANAEKYAAFVNFLFYPGPYGSFYGNLNIQSVKDDKGNMVPYNSVLNGDLSYGYTLPFGLGLSTNLNFASEVYTDSLNTNKLPFYINLAVKVDYELFKNFYLFADVNNILNKNNFTWRGYKERPFDMLFGVTFKW